MTKTVRTALNQVEKVLLKNNKSSEDLWNILSALRGPDTGDYIAKDTYTVPIRRRAFPKLAKDNAGIPATFDTSTKGLVVPLGQSHYERHIEAAQSALKRSGR